MKSILVNRQALTYAIKRQKLPDISGKKDGLNVMAATSH
jgi:hypothetical protein